MDILIKKCRLLHEDIHEINFLLKEKQSLLKKYQLELMLLCKHTWITDYIDINPDYTKTIIYCEKCLSTKNI